MKSFIFIFITFLGSCFTKDNDEVRAFIPGVYVTTINQEFSRGSDTLIIGVVDYPGNIYQVIRNTSFQRILDGKVLPMERKSKKWVATYDKDQKTLSENVSSATISFNIHTNAIYVGSKAYQRISNYKQLVK